MLICQYFSSAFRHTSNIPIYKGVIRTVLEQAELLCADWAR
jgi:hypothetical protein